MRDYVLVLAVVVTGLSLLPDPSANRVRAAGLPAQDPPAKPVKPSTSLRMTPGIVCRSIDGYENYERLPDAAQTSDEKLLVYLRPLGFKTEMVDGEFQAHLVPGFEIRKRGEKKVLLQKLRAFEYKPRSPQPPRLIYLKNVISVKGLPPGDYDVTIVLHDEIAGESSASEVIPFRIVPAADPTKKQSEAN
jgi:hypothetical protein